MSILKPPPTTKWNVLNLGAGVQSSTLALMAARGEITPMPDFAVFADTQAEPQSVYDWLDWLEKQLPFPVYRVSRGNLTEDSLFRGYFKKTGMPTVRRLIPMFGLMPNGEKAAAIGRRCTSDYKIEAILKCIKEKCSIKRGQKEVTVTQWIGISWDEIQRIKNPRNPWTQHRWPLIEKKMQRHQCLQWMKDNGYPEPRSACVYCPFHSDTEWRRLRDFEPKEFQKAIEFDKALRKAHKEHNPNLHMEVYLHNSCKPLDEVDFDSDEDKGQMTWDFQAECEGMCGL
jgi:hypothetical protein